MLDLSTNPDLKEMLKASIQIIKKKKSNLSSNAIANKLDISTSTFGRIINGEVRKPDVKHTFTIISEAYNEVVAKKVTEHFYPEVMANFDTIYKGNKDVPFIDGDAEQYFRDPATYELMLMATSEAGITRDKVKEEFGNKGIKVLEELLENEVLIDNEGVIGIKGNINARQATVQKLVENLIGGNYDIAAFGQKNNWLSLQYDSVNLETVLPQIKEIMQNANAEIRAVLNNPNSKGKDVLWAAMVCDSLTKQQAPKEVLQ